MICGHPIGTNLCRLWWLRLVLNIGAVVTAVLATPLAQSHKDVLIYGLRYISDATSWAAGMFNSDDNDLLNGV